MKQQLRTILEYLAAFVVIIILLLSIVGVVVVKFYGDELQTYVMDQINERLDSKAQVDEVSVKVFHKFPNTSLVLKNVVIWSSHNCNILEFEEPGADTLLTAESVSVSFNLLGMIRKKFEIRQIEIRQGSLQLLTDSQGEGNYSMLKEQEKKEDRENAVDISQLRISGFNILMVNLAKQIHAEAKLDYLDLNGRFAKRNTQIKGSLKGYLEEISNKGILYGSQRDVEVRLNMDFQDSIFTVNDGQLQIDRIVADVDGMITVHRGTGVELSLIAAARNLEIHEVLDLLPRETSKSVQEIRGNGILQLYTKISGMVSSTLTPSIEADFQTTNANLSWERLPFSLKNLKLSGSYSNGNKFNPESTRLTIESISTSIGRDHFSGRGQINNLLDPNFSLELKGDLHPEQWLSWYPGIPIDQAEGSVITDVSIAGAFDRKRPSGEKFTAFEISGGIALEDVLVRLTPEGVPFSKLNGSVNIENDFWEPSFTGNFGSSDFNIAGTGLNLISYLLKESELMASATFRADRLDLQEVLDQLPRDGSGKQKAIRFPENLNLRLEVIINDFVKEKLVAENVRGIALYDTPFFYVDSLTMQTMGGTMRGSFGMVQDSEKDIFANVDADLYSLDIQELFEAFNNFGQKQLTHEHLKGSISGTSVFSADFDSSFSIQPPSIQSESDIIIREGELNNFAPIMALSRFIEIEELQNIRFNTLENTILINNSQVIIPVMDIKSNAMDLSASGIHHFNNQYDYRFRLKLSDLLYGKARRSENSEFVIAEDESDTRILFLKMYDDGSGAKVEVDREKAAKKIREDLRNERSELKKILNEELGLFKHDDEIGKKQEEEGETFRFEFSDEPDTTTIKKVGAEKGRRRKRKEKTDTLQNKPATKFVIDE
ncbi:MAG: AsmA family protein [Bacteroidetes bacterium]|nr:AsmA family protein [Bacteroidota bacterium]